MLNEPQDSSSQEMEVSREKTREKYGYVLENIINAASPDILNAIKKGLDEAEDGLYLNINHKEARSVDGLTMNIKWGTRDERTGYDRIVADHLQNITDKEVGVPLTDLPKIMKPSFDYFKDGKAIIWNPIEIDGILVATGATIYGNYKDGVEGRIFPLDSGAWVANSRELIDAIISQTELQVDPLSESFDDEVRKNIIDFTSKLVEAGLTSTKDIAAEFTRMHHSPTAEKVSGEQKPYSDGVINSIKDQLKILENKELDWLEIPEAVISIDPNKVFGISELPGEIINPFTGEPMEKWSGILSTPQYRGSETYNMPPYLEEEIKLLGLDPFNVYDEKIKLPYFAVAENGARMVHRNIGGRFRGFMWDIPPAGRVRFFSGHSLAKSDEYLESIKQK